MKLKVEKVPNNVKFNGLLSVIDIDSSFSQSWHRMLLGRILHRTIQGFMLLLRDLEAESDLVQTLRLPRNEPLNVFNGIDLFESLRVMTISSMHLRGA